MMVAKPTGVALTETNSDEHYSSAQSSIRYLRVLFFYSNLLYKLNVTTPTSHSL